VVSKSREVRVLRDMSLYVLGGGRGGGESWIKPRKGGPTGSRSSEHGKGVKY